MYLNNQETFKFNGLYAHKSYISNNFKRAISEYKGVVHCEVYEYEESTDEIMEDLFSEPFFTKRMKLLSRTDGFMLNGNLGVDFFSTSDLLYSNMITRLRLIRARPHFYMISDDPFVSLGIVDCSFYTRRMALKDVYHEKRMDMLAYNQVEFNYLETLERLSSFLPNKTSSSKNTFSTLLRFVGLIIQWVQTLHSMDPSMEINSGINNLIADNLEYSEEVN